MKDNRVINLLLVLICMLFGLQFSSCKKDKDSKVEEPKISLTPKVYVVGNVTREDNSRYTHAALWIDGKMNKLSDDSVYWSRANFACAFDTNIYICGFEGSGLTGGQRATLWTNGKPKQLGMYGKKMAQAYCVAVSKNLVCVVGEVDNDIKLWKNNEEIILDGIEIEEAQGRRSLFVDGSDIYIVGSKSGRPILWKNGVITYLNEGITQGDARAVFVEGGNIYVSYTLGTGLSSKSMMWQNGSSTTLSDSSQVYTISVFNGSIYLGGFSGIGANFRPHIWKNNLSTKLDIPRVSSYYSSIPVFANANDVYICGSEIQSGSSYNIYVWKNSIRSTLFSSSKSAYATSIFVK